LKPKQRPLAFRLHNLFGLKLSLFLAFVCLTGTVATVVHEIEWLLLPEVRATATAEPARWGQMWDNVRRYHPDGWVRGIGSYDRSDASYFANSAGVVLPDGREVAVLVDPGSGAVTGEQVGVTFHSFMRGLHYYLFVPGDWGFYFVAGLGFALIGSLVSGLVVYKRFWKGLFRWPRFGRDTRTWVGDMHRLLALWSIPFVVIIGGTAVWYIFERAGVAWESTPPVASNIRVQPDSATVDRWVATAAAAMPGLRITAVTLPYTDGDPVIVQGQWQAALVRERTNAAFIDPQTGTLLGTRIAHRMAATERWVHTADPLHFGNFAGLATKLLWVVFGLGLTAIAASGAIIHGKRLFHAAGASRPWRLALGAWWVPSLLLVSAVPAWFFLNGWNSGNGDLSQPRGQLRSAGQTYQLWSRKLDEGQTQWCVTSPARMNDRAPLMQSSDGAVFTAGFDAGRYCANLPSRASVVGLRFKS
jgi:uncharacterized iron-regulated membrane protein